jgi:DNA-binding NarL/FixJ family response regulator
VKAVAGRTPVAVLGVIDSWAAARGAIGAGAAGYVPIMSSTKVVLHAVELMLGGGVYLPASVLGTAGGLAPAAANGGGPAVRLTPRQHAVLTELAKGQSNKQIANALDLSEATVKVHIAAIMRTLKVENRTQAVLAASQAGILDQAAA